MITTIAASAHELGSFRARTGIVFDKQINMAPRIRYGMSVTSYDITQLKLRCLYILLYQVLRYYIPGNTYQVCRYRYSYCLLVRIARTTAVVCTNTYMGLVCSQSPLESSVAALQPAFPHGNTLQSAGIRDIWHWRASISPCSIFIYRYTPGPSLADESINASNEPYSMRW